MIINICVIFGGWLDAITILSAFVQPAVTSSGKHYFPSERLEELSIRQQFSHFPITINPVSWWNGITSGGNDVTSRMRVAVS